MKKLLVVLILCGGMFWGWRAMEERGGLLGVLLDGQEEVSVYRVESGDEIKLIARLRHCSDATLSVVLQPGNTTVSTPLEFTTDVRGSSAVLTTFKKRNSKDTATYEYRYHWSRGGQAVAPRRDWIYVLPFEEGRGHRLAQGAGGAFSHAVGSYSENALDWSMPEGTPIKAARSGVVVGVVEHYSRGGTDPAFKIRGNYALLRHDDGSYAEYFHLRENGVVVSLGDQVTTGELIGYSGNTGYSTGPHLHFSVFRNLDGSQRETFPLRFRTSGGQLIETLKVGDRY